ncbi:MAG: penicillin-binding protein 2 [Clostridia bacterium]|nr:penicillin-binding protein 2 [Clostridia bacterium]
MKKRAVCVFLMLVAVFGFLIFRINQISFQTVAAGVSSSGVRLDIATLRGTVYDCNMKPLTNCGESFVAIAKPTLKSIFILEAELDSRLFSAVRKKLSSGESVAVRVKGDISGGDDLTVVSYPERYDSLACHIIGYLGGDGRGVSGVEKSFDALLSDSESEVYARVSTDANGRVLLGEEVRVFGNVFPKSGVVLTLDRDIQRITEKALDESGGTCAAAVVMDVHTGAIRACVSRPDFDRSSIASVLNDPDSPLINRAFSAFSVGSVFKPVVAAAALENGIDSSYAYECKGNVTLNGVTFNCHKKDGHGLIDMETALAHSCNTYFISLALEVGAEKIIETAKAFGFGEQTVFADSLRSKGGNLPDKVDSKAATANLAFGQGELSATPVQICTMMSVIANGGQTVNPYLIEGEADSQGNLIRISSYSERRQIISQETAELLQRFLLTVVENGSGSRARAESIAVAGKTATAQTGQSVNGEEIYNAWFAGYFPADNPKYAVVILKENGGEGAVSCAPVFKEIAQGVAEQ